MSADSAEVHETHDLTTGIDRSWTMTIAGPAQAATARFLLTGPSGAPLRATQVCLEHDHVDGSGAQRAQRFGACGSNLVLAPEAGDEVLFEARGPALGPGRHTFHATGLPEAGVLRVDLDPR
jgi:hypothetical protein